MSKFGAKVELRCYDGIFYDLQLGWWLIREGAKRYQKKHRTRLQLAKRRTRKMYLYNGSRHRETADIRAQENVSPSHNIVIRQVPVCEVSKCVKPGAYLWMKVLKSLKQLWEVVVALPGGEPLLRTVVQHVLQHSAAVLQHLPHKNILFHRTGPA